MSEVYSSSRGPCVDSGVDLSLDPDSDVLRDMLLVRLIQFESLDAVSFGVRGS